MAKKPKVPFLGYHNDETLNFNEEMRFKNRNRKFLATYAKKLKFSEEVMIHILLIYYKILKINRSQGKNAVFKTDLNNILHYGLDLTNLDLQPNIISVLDKSISKETSLKDWANMVHLYLKGNEEERIRYAYDVYVNKAKSPILNRSRLIFMLKGILIDDDDESLKDFVDIIMKKLDDDHDGVISFKDFRKVVLVCPLMLQSLGQVFPERLAVNAFATTFKEQSHSI